MTKETFDDLLSWRMGRCKTILQAKSVEYGDQNDILHNIKTAAAFERSTPEKAALNRMSKQLVSIVDMIHALDAGQCARNAVWDEKISDTINYLIILEALIHERLSTTQK